MPRDKRFYEEISKETPPLIIAPEEYEWAIEYISLFKCPKNFDPLNCDGHNCPVKPKPRCYYNLCDLKFSKCGGPWAHCFIDYYDDCIDFGKATMIIDKVQKGEIKIQQKQGWMVKL